MCISDWCACVCSSCLGSRNMRLLESDGQEIRIVDVDEIISREPALAPSRTQIAGGTLCPTDETGDSAKFTRALAAIVEARGGEILTGTRISRIERQGDRVTRILTARGDFSADAYVDRKSTRLNSSH